MLFNVCPQASGTILIDNQIYIYIYLAIYIFVQLIFKHGYISWSLPCEVSETLTASWLPKELTPIMPPWDAVLARDGIWLWLRGTL